MYASQVTLDLTETDVLTAAEQHGLLWEPTTAAICELNWLSTARSNMLVKIQVLGAWASIHPCLAQYADILFYHDCNAGSGKGHPSPQEDPAADPGSLLHSEGLSYADESEAGQESSVSLLTPCKPTCVL